MLSHSPTHPSTLRVLFRGGSLFYCCRNVSRGAETRGLLPACPPRTCSRRTAAFRTRFTSDRIPASTWTFTKTCNGDVLVRCFLSLSNSQEHRTFGVSFTMSGTPVYREGLGSACSTEWLALGDKVYVRAAWNVLPRARMLA